MGVLCWYCDAEDSNSLSLIWNHKCILTLYDFFRKEIIACIYIGFNTAKLLSIWNYENIFFCCVFVLSLASFSFLACLLRLSIHFIFSDNVHCTYFVLILQCMKVQNKLTKSNRNKLRSNCFQMWTLYRLCYTSTKYC